MGRKSGPRKGSLQFYPRVRTKKILPRVNWKSISQDSAGLLGFVGYKAGMKSALVRDNTPNSMTKGKKIILPVTIIECPSMKILSVRFYKDNRLIGEVLNDNLDKELIRKIKIPKQKNKKMDDFKKDDFNDLRVIMYSQVKKTGIKKTPDIGEIGMSGNLDEKIEFVKKNLLKEISVKEVLGINLIDIHGVTKGKGTQGATKRFGLRLKSHKSEKGVRNAGSGGSWHPCRVEFMQPLAGQMGFFKRIIYNKRILAVEKISEKEINPKEGFKHFGKIKTDYIIINGSVQGPAKRQVIITAPLRPTRTNLKKNYELIELR